MSKNESNVSFCRYYRNIENKWFECRCSGSGLDDRYCENNKDCYFRQLQRIEIRDYKLQKQLRMIKEIAQDMLKHDSYERSNVKAEKILKIIEGEGDE